MSLDVLLPPTSDGSQSAPKRDYFTIIWMMVVHVLGFWALFHFSWSAFWLFLGLYFVTGCLGITFCFHRLLSHRSFKAHPVVEGITALLGTLALQGTVQEWVGHHRLHHRGSDTPKDPHNARRGFWYSHWGWIFIHHPEIQEQDLLNRYTRDIMANRWLAFLSHHSVMIALQVALGFLLLAIGGTSWVLWGIFMRLVCVYHTTWLVNSATHRWGYRNFDSRDLAVNTWWVALLTWGEGWHNNHHRFANVCPVRFRWWEFDTTYAIVCLLAKFGLTYDIKTFPPEAYLEADKRRLRLAAAKRVSKARPLTP